MRGAEVGEGDQAVFTGNTHAQIVANAYPETDR